jgi:ATP-binding cassette subfamily F protein 3
MSGGERARLLLALATRDAPHLLILDEPTNHLDIDARDALVKALAEFEGAVLLISHDPYLVGLVADRLLLVAGGKVTAYDGDLEAYSSSVTDSAPARERSHPRKQDKKQKAETRSATAPLRQAVKDAELRLAKLAAEQKLLENKLAEPGIYTPGKTKDLAYINQRIAAIKRETTVAERDWLAAEAALEAVA